MFKFPNRILGFRKYSQVVNWPSREQTMLAKNYAERQHAVGTTRLWLWFNILITAPALTATFLFTVPPEVEHLKHLREQTPTWTGYSYIRKRTAKVNCFI
jgi:hypothetical protein